MAAASNKLSGYGMPGFNVDMLKASKKGWTLSVGKSELAQVKIFGVPSTS
ncbi:hypothetical protein ACLM44_04800 [Synechococcus sp. W2B2]|nr:hypothetical protein [Synechococcus sp. WH 7805]